MSSNSSWRESGDVAFWAIVLAAEPKQKTSVAVAHVKGENQQQHTRNRLPCPQEVQSAVNPVAAALRKIEKSTSRLHQDILCLLLLSAVPFLAPWQRTGSVHQQCSMPTLFPMPFLARLTSDHHHHALEGPQDNNTTKKRAHEQRTFEERHKEPKRPRLGTQILSSRPKIFSNGLLSPVKSVANSAIPDRTPGHDPLSAKTGAAKAPNTAVRKQGTRAAATTTAKSNDTQAGRQDAAHESKTKTKTKREANALAQQRSRKFGEDKRSLRSHDGGTRARSELAQYFPNWDEIISDEPLPQDPINSKTRLHISDELIKTPSTPSRARQVILPAPPTPCTPSSPIAPLASPSGSRGLISAAASRPTVAVPTASNVVGPPLEQTFTRVPFSLQASKLPRHPARDPLSEEHYRLAHQRGERQEKQLRNIEKEKAQHEKVQLERLYEGLLGRDWLRQMGISGVTDGEKRDKWEVKRDYVISEVKAMLDKFDRYREEEKRLKMEREANMRGDEESEHEEDDNNEDQEEEEEEEEEEDDEVEGEKQEQGDEEEDKVPDTEAEDDEQNLHEADHRKRRRRLGAHASFMKAGRRVSTAEDQANAAAKQLLIETLSSPHNLIRPTSPSPLNLDGARPSGAGGSKHRRVTSTSSRTGIDVTPTVLYSPAGVDRPFTSFFAKPHLRAAAIAGHRRGRARFAFGCPVPELEEREFSLPAEWVTEDSRRDAARLRRMRRRSKKMDAA